MILFLVLGDGSLLALLFYIFHSKTCIFRAIYIYIYTALYIYTVYIYIYSFKNIHSLNQQFILILGNYQIFLTRMFVEIFLVKEKLDIT